MLLPVSIHPWVCSSQFAKMATTGEHNGTAPLPRPVILYDGTCGYCRRQVSRIRQRDHDDQFDFTEWQDAGVIEKFPQLAHRPFNAGLGFVNRDGSILLGADAVHAVSRRLPGWRWVAWIYLVPGLRFSFRRVYAWIAANRHSFAPDGKGGSDMPARSPTEKESSVSK